MHRDTGIVHGSTTLENAGLILLWPFLPKLFLQLRLIENNIFHSKADAIHAAFLLEYLAGGHREVRNENMWINKLLCGIPLNYPVESPNMITTLEADECDKLLISVVVQWKALKKLSVDNLREHFLKRRGVFRSEEKAVLGIEPFAIDVLLDYIPWNISSIYLPWMDNVMFVEWR